MPQTDLNIRTKLDLDTDELKLITLGLRRQLEPAQYQAALELNARIMEARAKHLRQHLEVAEGAAEHATNDLKAAKEAAKASKARKETSHE